jgi:hypothetical protein
MLVFLLVLFLSFCNKEKLPKATKEGKNTFGCKVDGKVFIPEDLNTYPITPGLVTNYNESTGSLHIYATEREDENNNDMKRMISIDISTLQMGNNVLNKVNTGMVEIASDLRPMQSYSTNYTMTGTVNITRLDISSNVVSGNFSFKAALRSSGEKVITVTDGRFDFKY